MSSKKASHPARITFTISSLAQPCLDEIGLRVLTTRVRVWGLGV